MKRLFPILFLLILASVCPAKDKPNILWLITDNCNLDFGCFGRQGVHTPHLDQLAAEGVRYNQVFSTARFRPEPLGFHDGYVSDFRQPAPFPRPSGRRVQAAGGGRTSRPTVSRMPVTSRARSKKSGSRW